MRPDQPQKKQANESDGAHTHDSILTHPLQHNIVRVHRDYEAVAPAELITAYADPRRSGPGFNEATP